MKKAKLVSIWMLCIILLVGCIQPTISYETGIAEMDNMKLHFLNVGQGNAIFIEGSEGQTMLYDAGGDGEVGEYIVHYIRQLGYDSLDVMVISHPHADHLNGAPYILENMKVEAVYHPKVTHTTQLFERFIKAIKNSGLSLKTAKAGMEIPFGNIQVKVLGPCSNHYEGFNDYSIVLRVDNGQFSALLTGDIEALSENEILASGVEVQADILQVPHHGSSSSTTQDFLQAVNPMYSILSFATDNKYGHPHKEVMERLVEQGTNILRTDEQGNIVITYQKNQFIVETQQSISDVNNKESSYIDPKTGEGLIKGNKNSKIYHMPDGAHYSSVKKENIIWFKTEKEAIQAGYRRSKQ